MFTKEYVKQVLEETCGQYMQVTDEIAQQVFEGFTVIRSGEAVEHSVEPTLDTSPVFVAQPCIVCGQMVCNH
jgi:hypothetical protein